MGSHEVGPPGNSRGLPPTCSPLVKSVGFGVEPDRAGRPAAAGHLGPGAQLLRARAPQVSQTGPTANFPRQNPEILPLGRVFFFLKLFEEFDIGPIKMLNLIKKKRKGKKHRIGVRGSLVPSVRSDRERAWLRDYRP